MIGDYSFGELLAGYRRREGYSQERLAKEIGVPRSTISYWEHDEHLPRDLYPVHRIAKVLALSLEDTNCLLTAADPEKRRTVSNDEVGEIRTSSGWVRILREDISSAIQVIESLAEMSRSEALSKAQIRKLAKQFGLLDRREVNPHLRYNDGDISFWCEQGIGADELIMQFAARKIVLDIGERTGTAIDDQGMLSREATRVIPILRRLIGK